MADTAAKPEPSGETVDKTPDPPDLAALKAKNALLEQELTMVQTRQKMLATLFSSDVKPLEGAIKVDGDHPVESHILAYQAMNRAANAIAKRVLARTPARVLIHSESDVSALLGYHALVGQLEVIASQLDEETKSAKTALIDAEATLQPMPVPAAAAAAMFAPLIVGMAIRSAIDMLSLFRTDVSLKYKDITIGDQALIAAVCGKLSADNIAVYYSALVPPNLLGTASAMLDRLGKLGGTRETLDEKQKRVSALNLRLTEKVDELTAAIDEAAAATPPRDAKPQVYMRDKVKSALADLTSVEERLTAAAAAFDAFRAALVKPDDGSGVSALTRLLRAEKLAATATDAHLLALKVAAAGGGYKTKRSTFRSGEMSYSGGAIVEFVLFDATGKVVDAATLPLYTGFIQVKEREENTTDLTDVKA